MTNYNFGDIVLVPVPFSDFTGSKKRPAVIVSSNSYNIGHIDVIAMPITSQVGGQLRQDELEIVNWQKAGLLKRSVVKPILVTVDASLIIRALGQLEVTDSQKLRAVLQAILG